MILLLAFGGNRLLPPLKPAATDGAEAAVTLEMLTAPPAGQITADSKPAQLTFKAMVDGRPLRSGRLGMEVTAPPAPLLLPTSLPSVEGTALLQLSSELTDGMFAVEYLFPMPGVYSFDFDIMPTPGEQRTPSTKVHHSLSLPADFASRRRAWLFRIGLFALGGMAGVWYARVAHRQKARLSRAMIASGAMLLVSLGVATESVTFADHGPRQLVFPKGTQIIQGDNGWTLKVQPTPEQAVVGGLLDLNVALMHEGRAFSGAMEVTIHVYNLKDDQTVLRMTVVAPQSSTSQRFQLVKSVPHTCTVTARPISGASESPMALTAVLGIDVEVAPTPLAVKLQVLLLLLGVVGAGIAGGFFLTSGVRKFPRGVRR
jgi:hypothetical protein